MKKRTSTIAEKVSILPAPSPVLRDWMAMLCILVVTLPWWLAAGCDFIALDDGSYVTRNPMVLAGLTGKGIAWAFSNFDVGFWLPLTWLSLMLDSTIFGTGPAGYHATNVLLHIGNTLLVYFFLRRATAAPGRSLIAALLFAMHPLRVESVAWVTERKDVLFTFFGLWTLLAYVWYAQRKSWLAYVIAVAAYACSLMCKSMLVTMPVLLLLVDFWPLKRFGKVSLRRLVFEKAPFAMVAAVIIMITMVAQRQTNSLLDTTAFPMNVRIENAIVSYIAYFRDCFYFGDLSLFYPIPRAVPDEVFGAALTIFLGITAAAAVAAWRRPATLPFLIGWIWFVISLAPTIGLVQSGTQARADRFTYFPAIGLTTGAVFLWPQNWLSKPQAVLAGRMAAAGLIFTISIYMTLQLKLWRDPLALYLDGMEHAGESATLDFSIGYQLSLERRYDGALKVYSRALELAPNYAAVHDNIAMILLSRGDYDQAIEHLELASKAEPRQGPYAADLQMALDLKRKQMPSSDSQPR